MMIIYSIFLGFKKFAEINYKQIATYAGSLIFSIFLSSNIMTLVKAMEFKPLSNVSVLIYTLLVFFPCFLVIYIPFKFNKSFEKYARENPNSIWIRKSTLVCWIYVGFSMLLLILV